MTVTRPVEITELPGFLWNARAALVWAGIPAGEHTAVCDAHLVAKCPACGATVLGRELAAVFSAAGGKEFPATDPLARLLLGYCADPACDSVSYTLACTPHAAVDWASLPTTKPIEELPRAEPAGLWGLVTQAVSAAIRRQCTWRTGALVGAVLSLWLIHQWVTGGRIPILREPKTYTSEMTPAGAGMSGADDE